MTTYKKRIISAFYWLAGAAITVLGMLVGFVVGFFMSGIRTGLGIHKSSIDIWDSRYNDP